MKKIFIFVIFLLPCSLIAGDVVVKQKKVQFDEQFFSGVNGYYSTIGLIERAKLQERLEFLEHENKRLKSENDLLIKLLNQKNINTVKEPLEQKNEYHPTEIDTKVYSLLKQNCAKCHNEESKERLKLFDKNKETMVLLPLEYRALVYDKVNKREMPPSGPLNLEEIKTFEKWLLEESQRERGSQ